MKRLIVSGLSVLMFFSCQKTKDGVILDTPTNVKLLISSVTTVYDSGSITDTYTYNAENLPVTVTTRLQGNPHASNKDVSYTYDTDGKLVKMTIKHDGNFSESYTYTYSGNIPVKATYEHPGFPAETYDILFTAVNGKIASRHQTTNFADDLYKYTYSKGNNTGYTFKSVASDPKYNFDATSTSEFGTKNNPYKFTGSKWMFPQTPYANQNELVKETESANGRDDVTTYDNTFNDEGYPVHVNVTETVFGNQVTHSEIFYKYIKIN